MKTLSILVTMLLLTGVWSSNEIRSQESASVRVKVIYFHGNYRCMTCNGMEKYTRELLEQEYQKEMKSGELTFEVFNFDEEANSAIVSKYQIESSTLLLVKVKNGKEKVSNITDIGFSYAKNEPEKFKEGVRKKLNEKLM